MLPCRVKTVPLVCRAWRDAAKAPSVMWERVRLSLTVLGATQILGSEVSGEVHHPRKLAPWLAARSRSIHTLFICNLNDAAGLHMTEGCAPVVSAPSACALDTLPEALLDRQHEARVNPWTPSYHDSLEMLACWYCLAQFTMC